MDELVGAEGAMTLRRFAFCSPAIPKCMLRRPPARRWRCSATAPPPKDTEPAERGSKLVVVGLGNPGASFDGTRHNIGFEILNELLRRNGGGAFKSMPRVSAGVARIQLADRSVFLAQPRTFMNSSGRAVRALIDYHDVPRSALLIVADDMALPLGRLRLRAKGGSGGHNGLKSVEASLGTQEYARLRVGVGAPGNGTAGWKGHVLGKFGKGEERVLEDATWDACETVEEWVKCEEFQKAMDALSRIQGVRNNAA